MDIVERLRSVTRLLRETKDYTFTPDDTLADEAADEIERLREQERKMTNHALERMEEIERLREALKRIAEIGDHPTQVTIARSALQQKESE